MSKIAKIANRVPFAPTVALMLGGAAAVVMTSMPVWLLERIVDATGLSGVLAAAKAPLGTKARILMTVGIPALVALTSFVVALPIGRKLGGMKGKAKTPAIKPYNEVRDALDLANSDSAEAPVRNRGLFQPAPVVAPVAVAEEVATPVFAPEPMTFSAPEEDRFDTPYVEVREEVAPEVVPVFPPISTLEAQPAGDELALGFEQIADIPEMPVAAPADAFTPASWMDAPAPVDETPHVADYSVPSYTVPEAPVAEASMAVEPVNEWAVAEPTPVAESPVEDVAPLKFDIPAVEAPVAFEAPVAPAETVVDVAAEASKEPSINDLVDQVETSVRRRQLNNLVSPSSADQSSVQGDIADEALRDALGTLERLAAGAR